MLPPLYFSVWLPTRLALFWRTYLASDPVTEQRDQSFLRKGTAGHLTGTKQPLSFIIFRLDSLGDVVLTTPLFRELKRAYPESRCTVVLQAAYKSLLATNPYIDEILTLPTMEAAWLPKRLKRLLSAAWLYRMRLRGRRFDFAMSPRWDVDEHLATLLCLLTGASSRVGYSAQTSPAKRRMNLGFDAAFDTCLPGGPVRHEVWRNLAIAEALGVRRASSSLEIHLTQRDREAAASLLAVVPTTTKVIAIGVGAGSPGRRWPLGRYADTINRLSQECVLQCVIVCSADEGREAQKLARLLRGKAMLLCGAPLREVCAVLERCHLFIGNDSGCAHLAAAMNCKTIVISRHPRDGDPDHFNSPVRFAPYCAEAQVLQPATGLDECKQPAVQPNHTASAASLSRK